VAIMPLTVTGCGLRGRPHSVPTPDATPSEDAGAKSRDRVQNYLDAMRAKDVTKGRAQLCPEMYEIFDKSATGANGDFADHFTVRVVAITDVRPSGGNHQVRANVTVTASGQSLPVNLLFTVTRAAGDWCIAGETPTGGAAPATPS
jgi:hypothetical protein